MAGGNLPFGLAPSGSLTSYTPTLRELATDWVRRTLFSDDREGQGRAAKVMDVASVTPFGFGLDVYDAGREAGLGNYGTAGLMLGMAGAPGPGPRGKPFGFTAYHGSPHSFDKFDMSKIGTGEGAQAYGHGLYFAEREGVARSYRDALTPKNYVLNAPEAEISVRYGQDVFDAFVDHGGDRNELQATISRLKSQNNRDLMELGVSDASQINPPNDWGIEANVVRRADRLKRLEGLLSSDDVKVNPGRMYEVEINADPDAFLDWDKPLSEQPEGVRAALDAELRRYLGSAYEGQMPNFEGRPAGEILGQTDRNIVRQADTLREAGIPGIKYLDAGSRPTTKADSFARQFGSRDEALTAARQALASARGRDSIHWQDLVSELETPQTRNYVVFDDKLISIVRKYGIAGASAMLGYNILDGMDPAQADELKRIEGNQ